MSEQRVNLKSQTIIGLTLCWMALPFFLAGCGKEIKNEAQSSSYSLACGPKDQHGAYANPIDARKIVTLSVDTRFSEGERKKIESAVQTWNETAREIFKIKYQNMSSRAHPASTSDCQFVGSSNTLSMIKETDMGHWKSLGLTEANPGVTIRCTQSKNFVVRQVVMLNFELGVKDEQIESVVLHELGHSLGLKHSCSPGVDAAEYISCLKVQEVKNHPYQEAVMYPIIEVGTIKNKLTENDLERAACILGESK
jgi:hypothetical protein